MPHLHCAPCTAAWVQFMETLREYTENGIIDDINENVYCLFHGSGESIFLASEKKMLIGG